MAGIVAIDLPGRKAFTDDGRTVPITELFDRFGEETDDPAECASFVCGSGGEWFTEVMSNFGEIVRQ